MGLYLAYEIKEEDLPMNRLEIIMNNWFDFPANGRVHDFNSWLESARELLNFFKQCDNPEIVKKHWDDDRTPLRLAAALILVNMLKDG